MGEQISVGFDSNDTGEITGANAQIMYHLRSVDHRIPSLYDDLVHSSGQRFVIV